MQLENKMHGYVLFGNCKLLVIKITGRVTTENINCYKVCKSYSPFQPLPFNRVYSIAFVKQGSEGTSLDVSSKFMLCNHKMYTR